jgi:hypothetical protein
MLIDLSWQRAGLPFRGPLPMLESRLKCESEVR